MAIKKSKNNKTIAGVCGGIGEEFGIDPLVIRLIFVISTLMGFGLPIIIYIIMAVLMQNEE